MRYSGSKAKQSIQYNDKGQHLYSKGGFKYISKNKHQEVCVTDFDVNAAMVVNQAETFRFTEVVFFQKNNNYNKCDCLRITTDSQSRIFTADFYNNRIHILDKDGQFLRYIESCDLNTPFGLCVDTRENLVFAEYYTGKVKKIKCYM